MWPGDDLEIHATELGILVGSSSYIMAISGIIFGILADKFSRIKLLTIGELIFGLGLLINGFAPLGQGYITFVFFLILTLVRGFSAGGFYPIINSYSYDSTDEKERSQFFGILQASFQFFQIIGMLVSAILFQNLFWREYFWYMGLLTLIFALYILLKGKEPKRGSQHGELKNVLSDSKITYDYKLNKNTIRTTIFKPTNIIAFLEGIFTSILIAVPDFLLVAYLQSEHNISGLLTSVLMIGFGLPGGVLGSLAFSKLSDKLGNKNIRNRLYMIVFSAVTIFAVFIGYFLLPIPVLTPGEESNLAVFFSYPVTWLAGILIIFGRGVMGLWNINQPPILQAINLPEAQGTITSANQFLEYIGHGSGSILAGGLLVLFGGNYQITAGITMGLGIIGGLMWLIAAVWIKKDVSRISEILKERGIQLSNNSN
jgi:MFS family permease